MLIDEATDFAQAYGSTSEISSPVVFTVNGVVQPTVYGIYDRPNQELKLESLSISTGKPRVRVRAADIPGAFDKTRDTLAVTVLGTPITYYLKDQNPIGEGFDVWLILGQDR